MRPSVRSHLGRRDRTPKARLQLCREAWPRPLHSEAEAGDPPLVPTPLTGAVLRPLQLPELWAWSPASDALGPPLTFRPSSVPLVPFSLGPSPISLPLNLAALPHLKLSPLATQHTLSFSCPGLERSYSQAIVRGFPRATEDSPPC